MGSVQNCAVRQRKPISCPRRGACILGPCTILSLRLDVWALSRPLATLKGRNRLFFRYISIPGFRAHTGGPWFHPKIKLCPGQCWGKVTWTPWSIGVPLSATMGLDSWTLAQRLCVFGLLSGCMFWKFWGLEMLGSVLVSQILFEGPHDARKL